MENILECKDDIPFGEELFSRINSILLKEDTKFIKRKDQYLPKFLMKYRTVNENTIGCLQTDTMWFDKPFNFNDPYDCSITISSESAREYINKKIDTIELEVGKFNSENRKMIYEFLYSTQMEKLNNHIKNTFLVSCFSTRVDSMLMWSHYANSHKGICLAYDISNIEAENYIRKNLYPVIYDKNKFDFAPYIDKKCDPKYPSIASLFWKNEDWSYENEVRIVLPYNEKNSKPALYKFIKPTYIFLGANINKEDSDKIENIAFDREVKILKMNCSMKKYELEQMELIWKRRE